MAIDKNHGSIINPIRKNKMTYEDQTNADLSSLIEDLGIEVDAKNPKKPNKAELVAALYKYDGVEPEAKEDEEVAVEVVANAKPNAKKTKGQLRREQSNKYMRLIRVTVTSNSSSQTKADPRQVMTISWGNELLGYQTDRLILGRPWHIHYGALQNLADCVITTSTQNYEKNKIETTVGPAYNIDKMTPLTRVELDKMAKRQTIRDSSLEALIDE